MKIEHLARQIVEFYEKVSSWENSVVKESGLTPSQMHTIEIVGHEGPLRMRELADKKGVTTGTLTVTADRLVREGFLKREANEKDRRSFVITLTEKGEELFRRHHEFHVGLTEEMAAILTDEELTAFSAILSKVNGVF
ncbi:MAG: MarR family transcriptional regulator [Desulfobacterales bacterium]|nr:MarR family transcriptional regulator [Desulfobacterales bacterium]